MFFEWPKRITQSKFLFYFLHAATAGGRGVCVAQTCTGAVGLQNRTRRHDAPHAAEQTAAPMCISDLCRSSTINSPHTGGIGVRVLPASRVSVPKRYACALAARRREPDALPLGRAREERDFNFLFLIDAFALLRPFKSVFEWRSRYNSRYGIPKDWFLPFVVATIVAMQHSALLPAAFWQDLRTHR